MSCREGCDVASRRPYRHDQDPVWRVDGCRPQHPRYFLRWILTDIVYLNGR